MMFRRIQRLDGKRVELLQERAELGSKLAAAVKVEKRVADELVQEVVPRARPPELNLNDANIELHFEGTPLVAGVVDAHIKVKRIVRDMARCQRRLDRVHRKLQRMLTR